MDPTTTPNVDPALAHDRSLQDRMRSLSRGVRSEAEAAAAAREFEAMFVAQMIKPIFETLPTDGLMGGGSGEKMYRGLLVQEYGKAVARAGGIGIADQIKTEILRMQEEAAPDAAVTRRTSR